jgi:hypothetical protein
VIGRIERWALVLVLLVAGSLGFWLWLRAHDRAVVEQARVTQRLAELQASIDSLRGVERHWDSVGVVRRGELTSAVRTVQATTGASIPRADVNRVISACELTIAACDAAKAAASARADSAEKRAQLLEKRMNPRWRLFTEGGYDPIQKDVRLGAGTELRAIGQLHLVGRLDYRQPVDSARGGLSAFAGVRWYF